jgi:hypothetical protein
MSASRKHIGRSGSSGSSSPPYDAGSNAIEAAISQRAQELYGSAAPTAVAYSGLAAWFENDRDEFDLWVRVFKRMRN